MKLLSRFVLSAAFAVSVSTFLSDARRELWADDAVANVAASATAAVASGEPAPAWNIQVCPPRQTLSPELLRRVSWDFRDKTLVEAAEIVAQAGEIRVELHREFTHPKAPKEPEVGAEALKIKPPSRFDSRVVDLPLWAAVEALLIDLEGYPPLAWRFEGGVLELVARDRADYPNGVATYDLSNYVHAGGDVQLLNKVLIDYVTSDWDDFEEFSPTSRSLVGKTLVVRAPQYVHRDMESFTDAVSRGPVDDLWLFETEETVKALQALDRPYLANFQDATLDDLARDIEKQTGVAVLVHTGCRQRIDRRMQGDTFTFQRSALPLRQAMRTLSRTVFDLDLAIVPFFGRLVLMDGGVAINLRHVHLYDVTDFHEAGLTEYLVEALQKQTAGPWSLDEPGTGRLALASPTQLLVCQNSDTLVEVRKVIQAQRRVLQAGK
jgi:hypothetical protein